MNQQLYTALVERSDAELLAWRFSSLRPENASNLLPVAPDDIAGAKVERQYSLDNKTEAPVRCARCRKESGIPNHWNGFTLRLPDGSGINVGKDCGERHYGVHWQALMLDYNRQRSRQNLVISRQELKAAWPLLHAELENLQGHRWIRRYDSARKSLPERLPLFWETLVTQLTRDGATLNREERVRDYRAEEQRKRDGGPAIYMLVNKVIGVIAGASFITEPPGLETRVDRAVHSLEEKIEDLFDETDTLSKEELSAKLSQTRQSLRRLRVYLDCLSAFRAFTTPSNLRMLCNWMVEHRPNDGGYHFNGQSVQWTRDDGSGAWIVETIGEFQVPTLALLLDAKAGRRAPRPNFS